MTFLVSTSECPSKQNAVAPTSGTMDSIKQITRKITNTSCWTDLFSKVASAEAMVLDARKGVHKAVLCQEISYQIRSKCHRFISSKISSKMQSWKTALPPGRQALVWEPDLVCREALWNVSKRQLPQEVEKAVSEPQLISEAAAFTTHLQGAHSHPGLFGMNSRNCAVPTGSLIIVSVLA